MHSCIGIIPSSTYFTSDANVANIELVDINNGRMRPIAEVSDYLSVADDWNQRQWLKVFCLSIVGTATNRSDNRQRPITVTCDHNFQSLKFLEISRCNFYLLQQRSFCSCKIKLKIWFCWFFMSLNFLLSFLHIWRSSKWKTKKHKKKLKEENCFFFDHQVTSILFFCRWLDI